MKKTLLILILLILSFEISAQAVKPKKEINKEGWDLPLLSQAVEGYENEAAFFDKAPSIRKDEISVTKQFFRLKSPFQIERKTISSKESNIVTTNYLEAKSFITFSVNGKIFAYSIAYTGAYSSEGEDVIDGTTYRGTSGYTGCMACFFYLDEDGDGIFEARYSTWQLPLVPDWVKK